MVSSINENPTRLSGSHLMESFVLGICGIQRPTHEPLARQSFITPTIVTASCFILFQFESLRNYSLLAFSPKKDLLL